MYLYRLLLVFCLLAFVLYRLCCGSSPGGIIYASDNSVWFEQMRHQPVTVWQVIVVGYEGRRKDKKNTQFSDHSLFREQGNGNGKHLPLQIASSSSFATPVLTCLTTSLVFASCLSISNTNLESNCSAALLHSPTLQLQYSPSKTTTL